MRIVDITKPLDPTTVMIRLDTDEITMLEEALSEFVRFTGDHKVQAEYYGEEFLRRVTLMRDTLKDLIDRALSQ